MTEVVEKYIKKLHQLEKKGDLVMRRFEKKSRKTLF